MRQLTTLAILICMIFIAACDGVAGFGSKPLVATTPGARFAAWPDVLATAKAKAAEMDTAPVLAYIQASFYTCQPNDTTPAAITFHFNEVNGYNLQIVVSDANPPKISRAEAPEYDKLYPPLDKEKRAELERNTAEIKIGPREACLKVATEGKGYPIGASVDAFRSSYMTGLPFRREWNIYYGDVQRAFDATVSVDTGALLTRNWTDLSDTPTN